MEILGPQNIGAEECFTKQKTNLYFLILLLIPKTKKAKSQKPKSQTKIKNQKFMPGFWCS